MCFCVYMSAIKPDKPEDTITMTIRVTPDQKDFLTRMAEALCNTEAGVVRLAVKKMQEASEVSVRVPEEAAAA